MTTAHINIKDFIRAAKRICEDVSQHPLINLRQAAGWEFMTHRAQWESLVKLMGADALIRLSTDVDQMLAGGA